MTEWRVAVGGAETTAVYEPGLGDSKALFVAAHGAGSHMAHRSMLQLATVLRANGFDVVRFNFLYRARGSGAPDRMPRLQQCMASVIEAARAFTGGKKLVIGGRSMGGRVASMLAADGYACDALLLFAYPLHPAGKPEKLRDAHLPQIRVPVLCINGTRDELCRRELMERALQPVKTPWWMHWVEGARHSFPVSDDLGALAGKWLSGS